MIGCYTLIKSGAVVYVGKSSHVGRRVRQHRANGIIDFESYEYVPAQDMETAASVEEELIERYRPMHNRLANPNYVYPTTCTAGHHIPSPAQ